MMDDNEKTFEMLNGRCWGKPELYFDPMGEVKMQKLGDVIITGSTSLSARDNLKSDLSAMRERFSKNPIRVPKECTAALNFSCDIPKSSPLHDLIMSELERNVMSLIIEGKPKINKPRNIKYPNKKRARRIWKKWAKRYGVTPTQTVIPYVEIGVSQDENGLYTYHITNKK